MAAVLLSESATTTAGLFIVFGIAVLLAVDRWFAALGAFLAKNADRSGMLVDLLLALVFTSAAIGAWYTLGFKVRPFE